MLKLSKEEMRAYVERQLAHAEIIEAKKVGNTIAVRGTVGQEVITLEINAQGEEYIERKKIVEIDPITNEPGWVLTKTGPDNKPALNKFGHPTIYIVKDSKFKDIYEPSPDGPNLYIKKQIEKFIRAEEDIHFVTENGEMTIFKGDYIKITNLNEISGVSEVSFNQTYSVVEPEEKHTL